MDLESSVASPSQVGSSTHTQEQGQGDTCSSGVASNPDLPLSPRDREVSPQDREGSAPPPLWEGPEHGGSLQEVIPLGGTASNSYSLPMEGGSQEQLQQHECENLDDLVYVVQTAFLHAFSNPSNTQRISVEYKDTRYMYKIQDVY